MSTRQCANLDMGCGQVIACGGKLKIIASIEEPQVIAKILSHLERTAGTPQPQVLRDDSAIN